MKVAVCENGTGGDAVERYPGKYQSMVGPWVELTAVSPNRGFTGGNNIIIRKWLESEDCPPYFLLLNADTLVKPGAIELLVQFMDNNPKSVLPEANWNFRTDCGKGRLFVFKESRRNLIGAWDWASSPGCCRGGHPARRCP
jgi:hypothetical protein